MIRETWQGYEVEYPIEGTQFHKWVRRVRNGKVYWIYDYLYAAHYSERTARKHDENIAKGVYEDA